MALIQNNPRFTSREIAKILKISKSAVLLHLEKLGMVNRYDVWVPHNLSDKNLMDRVFACTLLLNRNDNDPFLKRLVTGDEKWIVYNNAKRKRHWSRPGNASLSTPKVGLHSKKVMLSVWWDYKGIIYYELIPDNEMINSDKYCSQLDQLKLVIDKKRSALANRKGVIFHQDNARPHVSIRTQEKLRELGWDILIHPSYSPDLVPSDYHLFRSLQNTLNGKNFNCLGAVQNHISNFFESKSNSFFSKGIFNLPNRWQTVINENGTYILE